MISRFPIIDQSISATLARTHAHTHNTYNTHTTRATQQHHFTTSLCNVDTHNYTTHKEKRYLPSLLHASLPVTANNEANSYIVDATSDYKRPTLINGWHAANAHLMRVRCDDRRTDFKATGKHLIEACLGKRDHGRDTFSRSLVTSRYVCSEESTSFMPCALLPMCYVYASVFCCHVYAVVFCVFHSGHYGIPGSLFHCVFVYHVRYVLCNSYFLFLNY